MGNPPINLPFFISKEHTLKALGHVGITDVICLMGFYTSVSMTLAFYDVPAGAEGLAR